MRKIDKPWGHELIWAETEKYAGKILCMLRGFCQIFQYHSTKDEATFVKSNVLILDIDNCSSKQICKLNPEEPCHISSDVILRMSAFDGNVDVVEAFTSKLNLYCSVRGQM